MKKTILITSILILVTGCKDKTKSLDNKITLIKQSLTQPLSSHFNSNTPILLESEEPIGAIDKLLITKENIILSDFYIMKSLKVFDSKGKLKNSRNDIGEGPFGMSEITDFDIYQDTIYVLDSYKRKIHKYTILLEHVEEIDVPISCNNFLINKKGIFLLRQGGEGTEPRITQFDHKLKSPKPVLSSEEANPPIMLSNSNLFTKLTDSTFVFSHPFVSSIWIFKNDNFEKMELDFENKFIDTEEISKMHPLDKLNFVNDFGGYYNIMNGIKLNEQEIIYSVRHQKKNKYLKINLATKSMTVLEKIKNDLSKSPSTISFAGNSLTDAWYWMDLADLQKFYSLNGHKITQSDRISSDQDKETKVVFKLIYK